MTKQEEILKEVARKLAEAEGFTWEWVVREGFEDEWLGKAKEILSYLHSQGVVIKVERPFSMKDYYQERYLDIVEPLIQIDKKEKK